MAANIGEVHVKVIVEVDVEAPVTDLDKKLAAIAMSEKDNAGVTTDWESYRSLVDALIELGWRPVVVDVTGKPTPKTPVWGHPPGYRTNPATVGPIAGKSRNATSTADADKELHPRDGGSNV